MHLLRIHCKYTRGFSCDPTIQALWLHQYVLMITVSYNVLLNELQPLDSMSARCATATIVSGRSLHEYIIWETHSSLSLKKRLVINGTHWLMCFVFPRVPWVFYYLLGKWEQTCISEKSEAVIICIFCLLLVQPATWWAWFGCRTPSFGIPRTPTRTG